MVPMPIDASIYGGRILTGASETEQAAKRARLAKDEAEQKRRLHHMAAWKIQRRFRRWLLHLAAQRAWTPHTEGSFRKFKFPPCSSHRPGGVKPEWVRAGHVRRFAIQVDSLAADRDASSSILGQLPAETTVQVVEIGTGSAGDRVKVRDYVNEREGWLSVVSADGSERFRPAAIEAIAAASPTPSSPAPSSSPVPSSSPAPSPKPSSLHRPEEALSFDAPAAAERPNAKYSAGMWLQCIGPVLTRQGEDLESPQLCRLPPDSLVQVLEIGTGPTGKQLDLNMLGASSDFKAWRRTRL
ncbi:unnamed protein product [Symbiodinium sp. CCMP2592]|nr:unnamed protein product [Symbiodinium sp. CCMP2592]